MPRIYFLQQWFNLADPAVEEGLYDWATLRAVRRDRSKRHYPSNDICSCRSQRLFRLSLQIIAGVGNLSSVLFHLDNPHRPAFLFVQVDGVRCSVSAHRFLNGGEERLFPKARK